MSFQIICTGSLGHSENNALRPQHLYFTSTGRIGVVLDVDAALSLRLSGLQRNIASCLKGPGGIDRTEYVPFVCMSLVATNSVNQMEGADDVQRSFGCTVCVVRFLGW